MLSSGTYSAPICLPLLDVINQIINIVTIVLKTDLTACKTTLAGW